MTATRAAFGTSSAAVKLRPRSGVIPSSEKYSWVTCSPLSGSGSFPPSRVGSQPPMAATSAKTSFSRLKST